MAYAERQRAGHPDKSYARLYQRVQDHLQKTRSSEDDTGRALMPPVPEPRRIQPRAKARLGRTARKSARPVARHMQVHVGMGTTAQRARIRREKASQTRKEKILRGKVSLTKAAKATRENLKRPRSVLFAATDTP